MRTIKNMMVMPAMPARMIRISPRREIEECSAEESVEESIEESVMLQLAP